MWWSKGWTPSSPRRSSISLLSFYNCSFISWRLMFTRSSVGKLAQKVTVMNGPSSARGLMTAGRRRQWRRRLAAPEKAVTFFIVEEETARRDADGPVRCFLATHAGLNALLQGALTAVVEGFFLLFHLHHKQQILRRFFPCFFLISVC